MNFCNRTLVLFMFCFGLNIFAQTKTNLEKIDSLISQSINRVDSLVKKEDAIFLEITTPSSISILKGKIVGAFSKKYSVVASNENVNKSVNYFLESVAINYSNPHKESFWGDLIVERKVQIIGSIIVNDGNNPIKSISINNSISDTVYLDEIKLLEDSSLPFTQSDIPVVPLLSNLFEPIVVVGTLIVTTILLFTVRSK